MLVLAVSFGCLPTPTDADVNGDGWVDELDRERVELCRAAGAVEARCRDLDPNGDGILDARDVVFVELFRGSRVFDATWPEFEPDLIASPGLDLLLLVDRETAKIHRYSRARNRILRSLDIEAGLASIAYSEATDRLLLGYEDGRVVRMGGSSPWQSETVVRLASAPVALELVEEKIYTLERQPLGVRHGFFSEQGDLLWSIPIDNFGDVGGVDWSSTEGRLYFESTDVFGPPEIRYFSLEAGTGRILALETLDRGDLGVADYRTPFCLDVPGRRLVLSSGEVFDTEAERVLGVLPVEPSGVACPGERRIASVSESASGGALYELWSVDSERIDVARFEGRPFGVYPTPDGLIVGSVLDGVPTLSALQISFDRDGDGVPTREDAFPLDPAAALDTDRDGAPDEWVAGYDPEVGGSTLALDAFPKNAACHTRQQALPGDPDECDVLGSQAPFEPARLQIDAARIVYAFDPGSRLIHRHAPRTSTALAPLAIGPGALTFVISSDGETLYVSYERRGISRFDLLAASPREEPWVALLDPIPVLFAAGPILLGFEDESRVALEPVAITRDGIVAPAPRHLASSDLHVWSRPAGRLYSLGGDESVWLGYVEIDPGSGEFGASGSRLAPNENPSRRPLLQPSPDGAELLLASGSVYEADRLELRRELEEPPQAAAWLSLGHIVSTSTGPDGVRWLVRRDERDRVVQRVPFPGQPLEILANGDEATLVSMLDGRPRYTYLALDKDADADGVLEWRDEFPLDPAASMDSDGDGLPDAWNPGSTEADSPFGLVLDAFPDHFMCQRPDQGLPDMPEVCDSFASVDRLWTERFAVDRDDIVYLFDANFARIYRYSVEAGELLDWIELASSARSLAYSETLHRLYVGGPSRSVGFVDLSAERLVERIFVETPVADGDLVAIGSLLVVATNDSAEPSPSDRIPEHVVLDAAGRVLDRATDRGPTGAAVWDPANERLVWSQGERFYHERIDPVTGEIGPAVDAAAWLSTSILRGRPIVSPDGSSIYQGRSGIVDLESPEERRYLGEPFSYEAVRLLDQDRALSLFTKGGQNGTVSVVELWDESQVVIDRTELNGWGRELIPVSGGHLVFLREAGRYRAELYVPTGDADGDGVPFREDAFPDDPAASVDSDGDGAPDAWSPGFGSEDSTTGLVLDAFPEAASCQRPEHADLLDASLCDFDPSRRNPWIGQVEIDAQGMVYLHDRRSDSILRFDTTTGRYLDRFSIGTEISRFAISEADGRIYVATEAGDILFGDRARASGGRLARFLHGIYDFWGMASVGSHLYLSVTYAFRSVDEVDHLVLDAQGRSVAATTVDPSLLRASVQRIEAADRLFVAREDVLREVLLDSEAPGAAIGFGPELSDDSVEARTRLVFSPSGDRILTASGRLLDAETFELLGSLTEPFSDAVWPTEDVVVTVDGDNAVRPGRVRQWDLAGSVVNQVLVEGSAIRVLQHAGRIFYVELDRRQSPGIVEFVPTRDADGDGVAAEDDAFLYDPAASLDRDGDGAPDAWNPGYDESDSTTGLVLDAFPDDPACQLAEHARADAPGRCNISRTIPAYTPREIVVGDRGIVYLFGTPRFQDGVWTSRIDRFDLSDRHHLDPMFVEHVAGRVGVSYSEATGRIYLAFSDGRVEALGTRTEEPLVEPFVDLGFPISKLAVRGDRIDAYRSGYGTPTTVLDESGQVLAERGRAIGITWDPVFDRYFGLSSVTFEGYYLRSVLYWSEDDPSQPQGYFLGRGPDDPGIDAARPILVSPDGRRVVDGSGRFYDMPGLLPSSRAPGSFEAGFWQTDDLLVVARKPTGSSPRVEQWTRGGELVQSRTLEGDPIHVEAFGSEILVVTLVRSVQRFERLSLDVDSDRDGVDNLQDDLPADPRASVDSDRDGTPDVWHSLPSTEGLEVDVFPFDEACQTRAHADPDDPTRCDVSRSIPSYTPIDVTHDANGIVYLVSGLHAKVFRWDLERSRDLPPLSAANRPRQLSVSPNDQRLYLSDDRGAISFFDLSEPEPVERPFAQGLLDLQELVPVDGGLMSLQSGWSGPTRQTLFDSTGVVLEARDYPWGRAYAWSAVTERSYAIEVSERSQVFSAPLSLDSGFTEDPFAHFFGPVIATIEDPLVGPIFLSPDGGRMLLASGHVLESTGLSLDGRIAAALVSMVWVGDELYTLREGEPGRTLAERWTPGLERVTSETTDGVPLGIFAYDSRVFFARLEAGRIVFAELGAL